MRTVMISCALALAGCADEYCEEYGACDGEILSTADWERIEALSPMELKTFLAVPPLVPTPGAKHHDIDNPYADDRSAAALGKKIFEDQNLGPDGVGCLTCHPQDSWFTSKLSHRPPDGEEFRGITSVIDVAYYPRHKWDGSKLSFLDLLEGAITKEHLTRASEVEVALRVYSAEYSGDFAELWPKPGVLDSPLPISEGISDDPALNEEQAAAVKETFQRVMWALHAYLRTVVSRPSRFDLFAHDEGELNEQEQRGLALFLRKGCDNCHSGPRFTDDGFHNIGLPIAPEAESFESAGKFRTPTLRNVAMTPPYMHTRAFERLDEVLWYYDHADHAESGELDSKLAWQLEITDPEVVDLVAFLETLTSTSCPWGPKGQCPPRP